MFCECKCGIQTTNDKLIPLNVRNFFIDQCTLRLLTLDAVDTAESEIGVESRSNMDPNDDVPMPSVIRRSTDDYIPSPSIIDEFEEAQTAHSPSPEIDEDPMRLHEKKISLSSFSAALDRGNVSSRFGALLATTLLKDLNIPVIIDTNKIKRKRLKARKQSLAAIKCNDLLKCISFDGKRDTTLMQKIVDGKARNVREMEEHITMVKEPGGRFIGYVAPTEGTGRGIMSAMLDFLTANEFSLHHLVAIGCDGTSTNTGKNKGVVRLMEERLQRPLQWLVCLFHLNELPTTALTKHLLGKPTGPNTWPGTIGSELNNCENIPVAYNFDRIEMGEIPPNIDDWEIRSDQRYLYGMVRAVDSGVCDEHLARMQPGEVHLSRWLTTASRILRLYVTKAVAPRNLKTLAFFIMKVYAPFWFLVKQQPQAIHGSRHLFKYIQWTRQLPHELKAIVNSSIQTNAFFAHSENILLSMITDADKNIRVTGLKKILDAGLNPPAHPDVRRFVLPSVKFHCESYTSMIDWNVVPLYEPPCIQFYHQNELKKYCNSDEIIEIPEFPCHSQSTERFVKVVSESCLAVIDKNRLAHIASKIESRQRYSKLESRKDFF